MFYIIMGMNLSVNLLISAGTCNIRPLLTGSKDKYSVDNSMVYRIIRIKTISQNENKKEKVPDPKVFRVHRKGSRNIANAGKSIGK